MFPNWQLAVLSISYIGLLFIIAYLGNKNRHKLVRKAQGIIYALTLGVYCTSWSFLGTTGQASTNFLSHIPIYLGPILLFVFAWPFIQRIIRVSLKLNLTSLADLLASRYGKSHNLAIMVTIVALVGTMPYIALQLKASVYSFQQLQAEQSLVTWRFGLISSLVLACFTVIFGISHIDVTERHPGVMLAIAFESLVKIVAFLAVGIFVTFFVFDSPMDIWTKSAASTQLEQQLNFPNMMSMLAMLVIVMAAFLSLPRQFQVAVVENVREKHLKNAIWMFPLYLLLFNVFVIFIAWAGNLTIGDTQRAEYYALLLPLKNGNTFLSVLVFLGGFSAVISMVVVATLALSTMVSNNLVIPYGFLDRFSKSGSESNAKYIKNIRRISIFSIIILAYAFYVNFSFELSLYSIGLIAFVIITQLAPSFFIGLFWNRGSSKAVIAGILAGFIVVFYTLILPFSSHALTGTDDFIQNGFLNIEMLKPHALFGIDFLSPPAHAFFWSMIVNIFCFITFSVLIKGNNRQRNYAEMYIDSQNYKDLQDGALVWKGEAYVAEIRNVLVKFLGEKRTERALNLFFRKYDLPADTQMADARLINFSEKLLTGSIGSASAKILISSVVKEEEVSLVEVLKMLEESKETIARNKLLREKSEELTTLTNQLKHANQELREKDKQKDEFLDTVAHELKTPITGIRATTELLMDDDDDMPEEIKTQFLKNMLQDSDRLSRLIHNILDFEKLSKGRAQLNIQKHNIRETIKRTFDSVNHIATKKQVEMVMASNSDINAEYDEDRILQVLTNLLSNALKFVEVKKGKIIADYKYVKGYLEVTIKDNGKGIPKQDLPYIFDKFYQSDNQNIQKPEGSGLGLAISKQIVENHNGKIWVRNNEKSGVTFGFKLPFK